MKTIELLRTLELFAELSDKELQLIADLAIEIKYSENQEIFHESSNESDMYILTSGKVQIIGALDKTESATIHMIVPGKLFGEFAFIDGQPRSATAVPIQESTVLKIGREALYSFFERDNHLGYLVMRNLSRILARRIRQTAHELRTSLMWERN